MRKFFPFTDNENHMMRAVLNNMGKVFSYFCPPPHLELFILKLLSDTTCARGPFTVASPPRRPREHLTSSMNSVWEE